MKLITSIIVLFIMQSCINITIVSRISEESDKFKVDLNTKPSSLIFDYTNDSSCLNTKNYFITFYDIYCPFSYTQIEYCNKLYHQTDSFFKWFAFTIYESTTELKYREKKEYPDYWHYDYERFYKINGLRSSLRNLYYQNNITESDADPMNMVIVNDSIIKIIKGAINNEEKYQVQKLFLDSIIADNRILNY